MRKLAPPQMCLEYQEQDARPKAQFAPQCRADGARHRVSVPPAPQPVQMLLPPGGCLGLLRCTCGLNTKEAKAKFPHVPQLAEPSPSQDFTTLSSFPVFHSFLAELWRTLKKKRNDCVCFLVGYQPELRQFNLKNCKPFGKFMLNLSSITISGSPN